jgi:hypothetical protein
MRSLVVNGSVAIETDAGHLLRHLAWPAGSDKNRPHRLHCERCEAKPVIAAGDAAALQKVLADHGGPSCP